MIKEPIYDSILSLKFNDAWKKAIDFSKAYPIKRIDKDNALIVLDIAYPIRLFTYFTWAEQIIISLKPLNDNSTMINVIGRVLLLPHHIFRSVTLNKKRIDKNMFLSNVKSCFNNHMAFIPKYTKSDKCKKNKFLILELLSIATILLLLIQEFLFRLQINSAIVIISVFIFLLCQAILIIWFTQECYGRIDLSNRERNKWITYICITGFIGCFFYYTMLGLRTKGDQM